LTSTPPNPPAHELVDAPLGASLAPVLIEASHGRLSNLSWFKSTWQHGGAATGFGSWRLGDGDAAQHIDVFIKLPVPPSEFFWTKALGAPAVGHDHPWTPDTWHAPDSITRVSPRVIAGELNVGPHDLAYFITERFPGGTLADAWSKDALDALVKAAVDLQASMDHLADPDRPDRAERVRTPPKVTDWHEELDRARAACRQGVLAEAQHWNDVLKRIGRVIDRLASDWNARPITGWYHGDVHPGNAMRRHPTQAHPQGPCALIDLALVHRGHWIEEAVYLERQFWTHPERLFGTSVVSAMARLRRELGLEAARPSGDYGRYANLRRVLMACTAPAHIARKASPAYYRAALELLERLLPQV
jgi:Phosphotransferase enzyme family